MQNFIESVQNSSKPICRRSTGRRATKLGAKSGRPLCLTYAIIRAMPFTPLKTILESVMRERDFTDDIEAYRVFGSGTLSSERGSLPIQGPCGWRSMLYVEVDDHLWFAQLKYMKADMLQRIERAMKTGVFKDLKSFLRAASRVRYAMPRSSAMRLTSSNSACVLIGFPDLSKPVFTETGPKDVSLSSSVLSSTHLRLRPEPHPEGGRFFESHVDQGAEAMAMGDDGKAYAWSALLHLDRKVEHVEGACLSHPLCYRAHVSGLHVVHIGFDHPTFVVDGASIGLADEDPQDIRPRRLEGPEAVPMAVT